MFTINNQSRKRMISINRNITYPEYFNKNARCIEIIELDSEGKEINNQRGNYQSSSNTNHDIKNNYDENQEIVNAQNYYQQLYNETLNYGSVSQDVIADIYRERQRGDVQSTTNLECDRAFRKRHSSSSSEDNAQYEYECTYNSHSHINAFERDLSNVYYDIDYYFRNDDSSLTLSQSTTDEEDYYSHVESIRVSTPITTEATKLNVSRQPSLSTVVEIAEPIITNISMSTSKIGYEKSPKNNWVRGKPVPKIAPATEIERYFSWIPMFLSDKNKTKKKKSKTEIMTPCINDINKKKDKSVQVEINEVKEYNLLHDTKKTLVEQDFNVSFLNMKNVHEENSYKLKVVVKEYDTTNIFEDLERSEAKTQNIENNVESQETKKREKSIDVEIESIFSNNIPNACMIDLSTSKSASPNSLRISNASYVPPLHLSNISKEKKNITWLQKTFKCSCCPWLGHRRKPNRVSHRVGKEINY